MVLVSAVLVAKLSIDDSHRRILPLLPVRLNVPVLPLAHTDVLALTVPPKVVESTVITAGLEFTMAQLPLCKTALYWVVCVKLLYGWLKVVLGISVLVPKLSLEYSQRKMLPILPDKDKVPELVPEQTVTLDVTLPPTVTGIIERVVGTEFD